MSNNALGSILKYLFARQTSMLNLILEFNNIQYLGCESFLGLRSLNVISLFYNDIVGIYSNAFYGLVSLRYLDLSKQHIQNISPFSFQGLSLLHHLNLSNIGDSKIGECACVT